MPFINTSGAGALIIDAELARRAWTGFYARAQPNEIADLETSGGIKWTIHDDFDFAHPVTAYDRLSVRHRRHRAGVLIAKLDKKTFVSISDGSDSLGWWPKLEVFTANRSKAPARAEVESARFSRLGVIDVPSGRVWLMDPCLHGADLKGRDEAISIDIPSGRYLVECRKSDAGSYDDLFVRLRRGAARRR